MDVSKAPPNATSANRGAATTTTATAADPGARPPANVAVVGDRANIRPLDIPGALQIFLAEIRSAMDLALASAGEASPTPATAVVVAVGAGLPVMERPEQAARAALELLLVMLPPDAPDLSVWSAASTRMESTLEAAMARALDTVAAWRGVPTATVDALIQARALVTSVLQEETQNLVWLRPEWVNLAPGVERWWRRRRRAQRRLVDPDYATGGLDDTDDRGP